MQNTFFSLTISFLRNNFLTFKEQRYLFKLHCSYDNSTRHTYAFKKKTDGRQYTNLIRKIVLWLQRLSSIIKLQRICDIIYFLIIKIIFKKMAEQEGRAETSSHKHTKEATKANTTKPENDMKTTEQTTSIWGRREDYTEKGKLVGL